jgi:mycothiol synthase
MLSLRSEPPADATTALDLDRISDAIEALATGTVGMFAPALLWEADEIIARHGATSLIVETEPVDELLDATLVAVGFDCTRELLQLRRALPVTFESDDSGLGDITITTRAFRPGEDEMAWLEINNRAFEWHPEQGGWTLEDVVMREAEPWFDPNGFLLLENTAPEGTGPGTGRTLDGFCWTKIHPATDDDPELGEIYVIAADPALHGQGLGRQLTLAGLAWLSEQGVTTAMLYVEADNGAARHVYEDLLGFHIDHAHRWYERELP